MVNRVIQVKRSSVSGRVPNATDSSNTQYIAPGELALNMADNLLYSSNGSNVFVIGSSSPTITTQQVQVSGAINIGDGTSNLTVNSTTIFAGNSSTSTLINTKYIAVSNSTANIQISPLNLFSGNSTSNLVIDMTGAGSHINISSASLNANGLATVQTSTNHGLTLTPGLVVSISNSSVNVFNTSLYTSSFLVKSLPTPNTITFSISQSASSQTPSSFNNNGRKIVSLGRSNGVATAVTAGPHLFSNGDSIFIADTILVGTTVKAKPKFSFNVNSSSPATVTTINSTAFSYPSQSASTSFSLNGVSWSVNTISLSQSGTVLLTINATNTLAVGDTVALNFPSTMNITWGAYTTDISNYLATVYSRTGSYFTIKLGVKYSGQVATGASGTFSSGTYSKGFDEASNTVASAVYVNQIVSNTSVGGSLSVLSPVGLVISSANGYITKITSSFIYIGPSASLTGTYISASKIQTGKG